MTYPKCIVTVFVAIFSVLICLSCHARCTYDIDAPYRGCHSDEEWMEISKATFKHIKCMQKNINKNFTIKESLEKCSKNNKVSL